MGIPSLFKYIIDNYTKYNILYWDDNYQCDYLYLDYNCLIHQVKNSYFSHKNPNISKILKMNETAKINSFIKEIIKYTQLIFDTVKPNKLFYIAVDGSVPYAKIHLQRLRRFINVKDEEYFNNLKIKYDIDEPELFDSNLITPGTKFMDKFSKNMIKYIKEHKFGKYGDNIEIIFDDSYLPGEGEQKILKHLKNQNLNDNTLDKVCIYGKDGDLIPLSLSLNINNIEILREPDIYSNVEKNYQNHNFILFSTNNLKTALLTEYNLQNINYENFIHDFTFLTLLVGNDFVKQIPFLSLKGHSIHKNGWHILLNIYIKIFNNNFKNNKKNNKNNNKNNKNNDFLISIKNNKVNINVDFFVDILTELSKIEVYHLRGIQNMNDSMKFNSKKTGQYEIEKNFYTHSPYTDERNPFYEKYGPIMNTVNYHNNTWKQDYYSHFFNVDVYNKKKFNEFRKIISIHYIESLIWTANYYLCDNLSWHFYYQYRVAPFISDILYHFKNIKNINLFKFKKESPFTPLEQLFFVLPPQNSSYLPKSYAKLMLDVDSPLIEYFPEDYDLDALNGRVHFKSNPLLPLFNINYTLSILKDQKISKTEQSRNIINTEYYSITY